MNTSLFIAKRLYNAKENNNSYTRPIIRIAILAVALSVSIMLLSVFILSGFKAEISDKVFGFGGHINISKFSYNQSYENDPINYSKEIVSKIELIDDVSRDLNNYDLEYRIQELESKFSKDLSEATFNELKELKKKQNIN